MDERIDVQTCEWPDLPCDSEPLSEPHGEDASAAATLTMAELMAVSLTAHEPALGRAWPSHEGAAAIAEARRDQADVAFRSALSEFCRALGLPVPIDWRRAQAAFLSLRLNA